MSPELQLFKQQIEADHLKRLNEIVERRYQEALDRGMNITRDQVKKIVFAFSDIFATELEREEPFTPPYRDWETDRKSVG